MLPDMFRSILICRMAATITASAAAPTASVAACDAASSEAASVIACA